MLGNRRRLLQSAAAAAAAYFVPRHVLGGAGHVAPSDKVNIALIGAGGQGRSNVRSLFELPDVQVTAVADPAESFSLEKFYYKGQGGRKPVRDEIERHYASKSPNFKVAEYEDFREMLQVDQDLDAVLCATPDHQHAHVTVLSLQAGKHVFCEKPLTHNIWEARRVARIARESGLATQMGNIGHSRDTIRETVEWIRDGAIGKVSHVHAWVGAGRWNPTLTSKPADSQAAPAGLNWDLWLGPRESRPFHSAYFPVAWRDFWSFGGGNIGDFGCHDLDSACWALNLSAPSSVEFFPVGPTDAEIGPHGCIGRYHFPSRGEQQEVDVTWYDGGLKPARPDAMPADHELPSRGVLFVGERGAILCGGAGGPNTLFPASLDASYQRPQPSIPRSKGHHRDWIDAIKTGHASSANFEYGARLTELALLGVLSLRTRSRIHWDADKMEAINLPQAEPMIREPTRKGY